MSNIRIIATPAGEAPEWVRKSWVNVILPIVSITEKDRFALTPTGALGGYPDKENKNGYCVDTKIAIAILESHSWNAARWWKTHINLNYSVYLEFGKQFSEIIND